MFFLEIATDGRWEGTPAELVKALGTAGAELPYLGGGKRIARQLREAGFRQMRATSLKGKHVETLLQRWQAEGL